MPDLNEYKGMTCAFCCLCFNSLLLISPGHNSDVNLLGFQQNLLTYSRGLPEKVISRTYRVDKGRIIKSSTFQKVQ